MLAGESIQSLRNVKDALVPPAVLQDCREMLWEGKAHLVLTGNVLIKLDDGGLRSTVVPLVGASYSF